MPQNPGTIQELELPSTPESREKNLKYLLSSFGLEFNLELNMLFASKYLFHEPIIFNAMSTRKLIPYILMN